MNELSILSAALRTDLASFIAKAFDQLNPGTPYQPNWHIEAIAHHLTQCFERKITRLVITVPPRHLKSIATSVAFVAWALGRDPSLRFICVSYAQELALKHSLDARAVMESDWYRRIFPRTRIHPDRNTQLEVMTTLRGSRLATSVEGTLTGRGGNFLIIDDAHKPDEALSDLRRQRVIDWVGSTLYSRLDNKAEDVIIVIQQRLHEDDLAGHFIRQNDWVHLNLPAIAEDEQCIPIGYGRAQIRHPGDLLHPEREPKQTLDTIRQSVGSYNFAAQYQQRPVPQGGGIIQWLWFRTYEQRPTRQSDDLIVQSWDTASKADELNDYSVGLLFLIRDGCYYLLEITRKRLEYPELRR
ncbi:MAG: terminase [Alphaproteobacteria bacterium]